MTTKIVRIILSLCLSAYASGISCPSKDLIKPCVCNSIGFPVMRNIECTGNNTIDLVKIFENVSKNSTETEKHFSVFHLSNTAITELKDNTFKDITFDEIFIGYCNKLTKIGENAFNGTDREIKYFHIHNNPGLSSPDNSIFKGAKRFTKLIYFRLENTNVTDIPTNAFGSLEHLLEIHFSGNSLKKIEPQAFSNLTYIQYLTFDQVSFTSIPDKAFEFVTQSNLSLSIEFSNSPGMKNALFSPKAFLDMKRPVILRLGSNKYTKQVTYLDEKVFLPFLMEQDKHNIYLNGQEFDCNDCRNYWLKKNANALNRISLSCSDKKMFNDPGHFKNCTS